MRDVQEETGGARGMRLQNDMDMGAGKGKGCGGTAPPSPHSPNPQGLAHTISHPLSPLTSED